MGDQLPYSEKTKITMTINETERMVLKAFDIFPDDRKKALQAGSLVAFLWISGCRISEALAVKKEDIKIDDHYLNITVKALKRKEKNLLRVLPFELYDDEEKNFFLRLILLLLMLL